MSKLSKLLDSVNTTPGMVFRLYMAVVLLQFSIISFAASIPPHTTAEIPILDLVVSQLFAAKYWWGVFSFLGAASLVFRSKLSYWPLGAIFGDCISIIAFGFLGYDYATDKPPIFAGSILATTAVVFLIGGLLDERRRKGLPNRGA